ncbi:poly-beta-1,6-N-acetyl-D-glucosamine biosynthesis protein PgaD [Marinobacter zhejiangensis]|uniref:Biofilm PGA synthesis protein PgaD n=1 Tax=Marinobacter zhejiangensis TaxID=488535 RepID=A0A1I4PF64_9GAMM|nr:poly-beta-1,6-N-acetyl-D-glucosamine biosynthesis protein PgaD [Marinobacter zhejiangensis]SFM26388.1 biofilm PGA synthesis protein PgaD [Marinobacter zhejiangensis]
MMLIQTQQHWLPRLLNIIFTLLAWAAFAYLMIDGINTLLHGGPRPKEFSLPGEFFATLHSLLWYLVMAAALSAVLLGWAKYNERRAARYHRRKRMPDITEAQLAASFGVSVEVLKMMQQEQVLVLFNDGEGRLSEASFVRQDCHNLDVRSTQAPLPETELLAV